MLDPLIEELCGKRRGRETVRNGKGRSRRETKGGRRGKKETKEGTCVWVRERNGEKEKERGEKREGERKRYHKIQYHEDKVYPFSVGASEGSAVGHTSSRHKDVTCNIADLILKFLRGAGERKRLKN